jgi:hypothetical protein
VALKEQARKHHDKLFGYAQTLNAIRVIDDVIPGNRVKGTTS